MKVVKRGKMYYVRLRRGGVEEWICTNKTSEREAKHAAEKIIAPFDREKHTLTYTRQLCRLIVALAKKEITKDELSSPLAILESQVRMDAAKVIEELFPLPAVTAADLWANYETKFTGRVKASTMDQVQRIHRRFVEYAGDMDLRNFGEIMARKFLADLNRTPQTQKNYISALANMFSASDLPNPWSLKLLDGKKIEYKTRQAITFEQAKAVISFCDANPEKLSRSIPYSRWAQFLRTLYYTGLRPVDVCHLRRDEIVNGVIELMPEKTSRTRKKVSYRADAKLLKVLETIPDNGTPFFFPEFARDYDDCRANPDSGFRRILVNAKLEKEGIALYGFRHRFVTQQIDSGNTEEDVAAAVGHVSTETTKEHYYHGKRNVELSEMPEL